MSRYAHVADDELHDAASGLAARSASPADIAGSFDDAGKRKRREAA